MTPVERRRFGLVCLVGVAAVGRGSRLVRAQGAHADLLARYPRVLLTGSAGEPLRAGGLDREQEYLFFYPFASTPCLLLDLGHPVPGTDVPIQGGRTRYAWSGGVGPRRSIVAFTAICPHQWSHPERPLSPIGYHRTGEPAAVAGGRDGLIVCCAHGSTFDPRVGGRVEQPPADLPLAAVALVWDDLRDELFAEAVVGPHSFEPFFRAFRDRRRQAVEDRTPVMRLREYSTTVARC